MMVDEIEELFEPKFPVTLHRLNRLEKENRDMMIHEFEQLTGIQVAPECWDRIEYVYMNCEQFKTKEQIADYYKKHDMNGIEKLYKELKEKEQAHHYILKINAGKYGFEYRSADIYKILDALDTAAETFGFEIERAQAMKTLVDMEYNEGLSHYAHRWGVKKVKGELKEEEER